MDLDGLRRVETAGSHHIRSRDPAPKLADRLLAGGETDGAAYHGKRRHSSRRPVTSGHELQASMNSRRRPRRGWTQFRSRSPQPCPFNKKALTPSGKCRMLIVKRVVYCVLSIESSAC